MPPEDRSAKTIGQPKGGGRIATPSRPSALIWNTASTSRDRKRALLRYGQPALRRAYQEELADLRNYLASQLATEARRLGIKTR